MKYIMERAVMLWHFFDINKMKPVIPLIKKPEDWQSQSPWA
jgi:hypothetical protein